MSALPISSSQGTAWLNSTTVVVLNGSGKLITLDVEGHASGSEDGTLSGWEPTIMTNWIVANDEVVFEGDYTDVEYNPLIDPEHIFASVTKKVTSEAELLAYNYDSQTGDITLNTRMVVPVAPNGQPRQPREIAFDSDGNLYYSGFAGSAGDNLVMKLPDATNIASWSAANIEVFYHQSGINSSFNGLDVAITLPMDNSESSGDYNGDEIVDAADYVVWRRGIVVAPTPANYEIWRQNFGQTLGVGTAINARVPEPDAGVAILGLGMLTAGFRRRKRSFSLTLDIPPRYKRSINWARWNCLHFLLSR